jgi:hypothetical protein
MTPRPRVVDGLPDFVRDEFDIVVLPFGA